MGDDVCLRALRQLCHMRRPRQQNNLVQNHCRGGHEQAEAGHRQPHQLHLVQQVHVLGSAGETASSLV